MLYRAVRRMRNADYCIGKRQRGAGRGGTPSEFEHARKEKSVLVLVAQLAKKKGKVASLTFLSSRNAELALEIKPRSWSALDAELAREIFKLLQLRLQVVGAVQVLEHRIQVRQDLGTRINGVGIALLVLDGVLELCTDALQLLAHAGYQVLHVAAHHEYPPAGAVHTLVVVHILLRHLRLRSQLEQLLEE